MTRRVPLIVFAVLAVWGWVDTVRLFVLNEDSR